MNLGKIGIRYSKALYDYAKEQEALDTLFHEFIHLERSIRTTDGFSTMLKIPTLSYAQKKGLLQAAIGGDASYVYDRFIKILLFHHREEFIYLIVLQFLKLYADDHNITVGWLKVPVSVSKDISDRVRPLANYAKAGKVVIIQEEDPSLIGGFILDVESKRLDVSFRESLQILQKAFTK